MKSIKNTAFALLLFATTLAHASLDTCYTVFETGFEELGMEYGTTLFVSSDSLQIGEEISFVQSITEHTFGHRRQVIEFFDCQYNFLILTEVDIIKVYHVITQTGLEYWFFMSSQQTHLLFDSQFVPLSPCIPDGLCFNRKYCKAQLRNSYVKLTPISQELEISPAEFETVTEQVLLQESYSTLQITPAQFETITEQFLIQETNICPDQTPIYETVTEQVLVKEAYTTIIIVPAMLTTFVEEVLVKEAYIAFEIMESNSIDSLYIVTTPEYIDYDWSITNSTCPADIYNCTDLETIEHQEQVTVIPNPSTWACLDTDDWNNQVLIRTEVPAVYGKRCYKRLVAPATTNSTQVPATYTTLTKELLVNDNDIPDSCIVRQYETRSYLRLYNPATTVSQEIPAIYETRQYERLIAPGTIDEGMLLQDCSQTFDYNYLSIESTSQEEEINCNYIYDLALQQDILKALYDKGYLDDPGTEFGSKLFWEAVLEVYKLKSRTECISNLDDLFFNYIFDL